MHGRRALSRLGGRTGLSQHRNRSARQLQGDENSLALEHSLTFRGENLETPNLVLFNFKNFFTEMYYSSETEEKMKKKEVLKDDIREMWYCWFTKGPEDSGEGVDSQLARAEVRLPAQHPGEAIDKRR